jgi:hypothetical protein
MSGFFGSRMVNLIGALVFFVVAAMLIISAVWYIDQLDEPRPAAKSAAGAPRPEAAAPRAARPALESAPARSPAARPAAQAQDRGVLTNVSSWINSNLGFAQISNEAKRTLSLIFTLVGTFFTVRTYFINRRRAQLLEERSRGEPG